MEAYMNENIKAQYLFNLEIEESDEDDLEE